MAIHKYRSGATGELSTSGKQGIEGLDRALKRYCLSLTRSPWDAEDLAQEAWLKALQGGRFSHHPNREALLLRINKNAWIDRLRKKALEQRVAPVLSSRAPWHRVAAPDLPDPLAAEDAFRFLVNNLSSVQLAAFVLREVLEFSGRESAALLQTSEGAVKAALHRAQRALELARAGEPDDVGSGTVLADARSLPATGDESEPEDEDKSALVRDMAEAYNRGDVARLLRLVSPAVVHGPKPAMPPATRALLAA